MEQTEPQEQKPERPFKFRLWAVVIALNVPLLWHGALSVAQSIGAIPTLNSLLLVFISAVMLAAAIGFWLERKWGLWLYVVIMVGALVLLLIPTVSDMSAEGAPFGAKLLPFVIPVWLLIKFYRSRHQFK